MKKEYESTSGAKARCLQEKLGHPVSHGSEGACPACGQFGVYDLKGIGLSASSIYYSMDLDKWCCMACGI